MPAWLIWKSGVDRAILRFLAVAMKFLAIGLANLRGNLQRFLLCDGRERPYA